MGSTDEHISNQKGQSSELIHINPGWLPGWYWEVDAQGFYTVCSSRVKEFLGYTAEEVIGKSPLFFMPEEEAARVTKLLADVVAKKLPVLELEIESTTKDHRRVKLLTSSEPMLNGQGGLIGYRGVDKDITEIKKAEQTILKNQRLSEIGIMTGGVMHDFNNAIQMVLGSTELALAEMGSMTSPSFGESLSKLADSIDQALADDKEEITPLVREQLLLVKNVVIDVFRNEQPLLVVEQYLKTAKQSLKDAAQRVRMLQQIGTLTSIANQHKPVDIKLVIEDVIIQLRPLWKDESEGKGITIDIKTNFKQTPKILGEESELRMILFNLLKNAIEALPSGGTITIKTKQCDYGVGIYIEDDGVGMSPVTVNNIFQPFFSTKGECAGRGLGLSAVRSMVIKHDGQIRVAKTSLGHGTTMEIDFRIANGDSEINNLTAVDTASIAHYRVLVVDDLPIVRNVIKLFLEKLGHTADIAENGNEALAKLETAGVGGYDIVITDVGMPNMSGWELLVKIRQNYGQSIKVIVLSGLGAMAVNPMSKLGYEPDLKVGKPISLQDLKTTIKELFE